MKNSFLALTVAFSFLLLACSKKKDEAINLQDLDCDALKAALIANDKPATDAIMDALCADFPSNPTSSDPQGHQENLNTIIEELNGQCPTLNASLGCYACMESLPPWSVIAFSVDSAGVVVSRGIPLLTPSDGVMRSNW